MYTSRNESRVAHTACRLILIGIVLAAAPAFAARSPAIFYVSSSQGKDSNKGLSAEQAWKSLKRVQKERLVPGDQVQFRAGDHFTGQLIIDESGQPGSAITFTAYGEGPRPILNAGSMKGGSPLATVLIQDQDHIEIEGLEVRNFRKSSRPGIDDADAYGILVQNTGKRSLRGFEFHNLAVKQVYSLKLKNFNKISVSGIRFETRPGKNKKEAANTGDIYLHDNLLQHIGRFGMSIRHLGTKNKALREEQINYDVNVRITRNKCEDIGGSCVLMNGVWNGLLEGNTFIRSGSDVQPDLMARRGSGAWFFRSRHIVAQRNTAISSRGDNDTGGIHVDYANKNILVQYNFFYDNEGYGTEILGHNENVIWRHNISVGDGTRRIDVLRPDGKKSNYPGKTIFVSNFSKPKRIRSRGVYIYNNTYVITKDSKPQIEINGEDTHIWNNVFVMEAGSRLGEKMTIGWGQDEGVDIARNAYSGPVSPAFTTLDADPVFTELSFSGEKLAAKTYALPGKEELQARAITHPPFPAAGKGIFAHVTEAPSVDFFDNPINPLRVMMGAGSTPR